MLRVSCSTRASAMGYGVGLRKQKGPECSRWDGAVGRPELLVCSRCWAVGCRASLQSYHTPHSCSRVLVCSVP